MNSLLRSYRAAYEQCFIPIFVRDAFDTGTLLAGCELAGVRVIEYTLRRPDAAQVVPALKARDRARVVFAGSTIDADDIVRGMRRKHPQLMTLDELCAFGVDGFISYMPFADETLRRLCGEYILIPSAGTVGEALRQMRAGAHFIKLSGAEAELIRALSAAPTFGFCPLFVTGGITMERMPDIYRAGAVITAAGFDLILRDFAPEDITPELIAERLRAFINAAKRARLAVMPHIADFERLPDAHWLNLLNHYHPFSV